MASLSIEEGGSSLSSLGAATGNSSSNSLQTASPTVTVLPDKVNTSIYLSYFLLFTKNAGKQAVFRKYWYGTVPGTVSI